MSTLSGSQFVSVMPTTGMPSFPRFVHGDPLHRGIDHEHHTGQTADVLESAEVLLEAGLLLAELDDFRLGKLLMGAVLGHPFEGYEGDRGPA